MSKQRIYYKKGLQIQFFIVVFSFSSLCVAQAQDTIKSIYEEKVNIAYGTQSKISSTAAISSISGDDLNMPVSSLSNALSGKIAGLTTVLSSGEPGNDVAKLYIRGRGSYNVSDILVYVDGVRFPFDQLSSLEIESISIFKDAAALSQFGIEGANGVVWVTTKRGLEGPVRISLRSRIASNSPTKRMFSMESHRYASLYNEAYSNDRGAWSPIYSSEDIRMYQENSDPLFHPNVDWYNEVVKGSTPYYDANLSIRGGGASVKYAVNLGYQNSEMLYKQNQYTTENDMKTLGSFVRYNFRANADLRINKIFAASANLGGVISDATSPGFSTNSLWNNLVSYPANIYPVRNPDDTWGGNAIHMNNPVASVFATGKSGTHKRFIQAKLSLSQDLYFITKGLSLTEAISFTDYFEGYYNKKKDYQRDQAYIEGEEIKYLSYGQNTDYVVTDGSRSVWQKTNSYLAMDYSRVFSNHSIKGRFAFKQDYYIMSGRSAPYFKQAFFGYLRYNYLERYFAEFGYSYSGSENFAKGKRFGFFPSISGAWILSQENFLKEISNINFLKLRLSAGILGNDNIGKRFLCQSYYGGNLANGYILGTSAQITQNFLSEKLVGNPNITWEKSYVYNLGVDFFFLQHFSLTLDLFHAKRVDIISQKQATVPAVYGNILPYENVGKVTNRGLELELEYKNKFGALDLSLSGILSFSRNRIDFQEEPIRSEPYLYTTGRPVGQPFGFVSNGFYQIEDFDSNGNLLPSLALPSFPVKPGDLKYIDQNKDGFINSDDKVAIAYNSIPEATYSFNIFLKYRWFDFNSFFQGAFNRSVYLSGDYAWAFTNNASAPQMAEGRWAYYPEQGIDTRATATYPRLTTEANDNNHVRSTFWTKNGNYLRLKTLEFGYTLPKKLLEKIHINDCRFFVGGANLLSMSGLEYYDPEIIGGYPLNRSIYVGFNLEF